MDLEIVLSFFIIFPRARSICNGIKNTKDIKRVPILTIGKYNIFVAKYQRIVRQHRKEIGDNIISQTWSLKYRKLDTATLNKYR